MDRKRKRMFSIVRGDLFGQHLSEGDAYMHCIARDLRMGKGIAAVFTQKFGRPAVPSEQKEQREPCVIVQPIVGGRFVLHIVTKALSKEKPSQANFTTALDMAFRDAVRLNVGHVYMPRIGSGLDRLDKDWVEHQVRQATARHGVNTTMYEL